MAALGAVASVISAVGGVMSGVAAKQSADFEAAQQEQQGKEAFAASQRDAEQARREAQIVQSRQQALAAASGGGADVATIVKLMTDTAKEGEMNAQSYMYSGLNQKRGYMDQAMGTRMTGRASMLGSFLGAAGTLAGSFGKYYEQTKLYG